MLFEASITILKDTTQADPKIETLKIAHGIITKIMVRPRPGHSAVAHLVILHHEHQIAPSTEGMELHGDFWAIDWEEYYESYQPPYELKLKGWNDSTKYSHTFDVLVAVLPRKAIIAFQVADTIKGIFSLLSPRRIFTRGS